MPTPAFLPNHIAAAYPIPALPLKDQNAGRAKSGTVVHIPFVQTIFHHCMISKAIFSAEIDVIHIGFVVIARRE